MSVSYRHTGHVVGASLFLFCIALILTAYSARNPRITRVGSVLVSETLRPLQTLNRAVYSGAFGVWDSYINLVDTHQENRSLQSRLAVLEAENSRLLELENENLRLTGLLKISEQHKLEGIVARVIAYDPSNWVRAISIDKGAADGISTGMAVIEGNGVVGQVIAAGISSARVLLLTDLSSGVDAIVQSSRSRGVVEGTGAERLRLSYVLSENEINLGDRVITSGMDGVFPKGLLVGIVSDIAERERGRLFQKVEVASSVDFAKLESVLVVAGSRSDLE